MEFKEEINKLHKMIDNVSGKEIKNLDDRTLKLEESINKVSQQLIEKFRKLESDFKFNIGNIESKNMEIANQARDLKDSFDRTKKSEERVTMVSEPEPEVIKRVLSPVMSVKHQDHAVIGVVSEETKVEIKNDLNKLLEKRLEEIRKDQDLKMEDLYKDFLTIKRNTVD
jgi:hypothetical protein